MEKKVVEKYGLRLKDTDEVLGYYHESNHGADFAGDTRCHLSTSEDKMWLVDDKYQAEYVRNFTTPWYNAGYETPMNDFDPDELEVVKVKIVTEVKAEEVSVPTFEQYLELKYKEKEPAHYEYTLKEYKEHPQSFSAYSVYDLLELVQKKLWR